MKSNSSSKSRNGKKFGKNAKYSRNGKANTTRTSKDEVVESKTNDPSWYTQSEAMLRDSASFPFNEAIGTPVHITDKALGNYDVTIPGVLTMAFMPTLGNSSDSTSGVNVAAKKLFNTLRAYNNSGNPPYDPNDLMMVLIAIANVIAYINMCVRLYGIMNLFVYKNRYLPKVLIGALNFDYDDFRDHMAQFRWDIDYMVQAVASLWAPGNVPYFAQCAQMYSGYYVEGDDIKDQLYAAIPYSFLQYEEASATYPGGRLVQQRWLSQGTGASGLHTRADILSFFNQLMAPIINNTDVNLICGDVRKAFGDNIIKVGDVPLNYTVLPTPDLTMLEKFKNANCIENLGSYDIVPDATQGYLISNPLVFGTYVDPTSTALVDKVKAYGSGVIGNKKLLTTIRTAPSPADVMEMTRWTPMIIESTEHVSTNASGEQRYSYYLDCGTYIPMCFFVSRISTLTGEGETIKYVNYLVDDGTALHDDWAVLSCFKFHPEVRIYLDFGSIAGPAGSSYDIDNYTTVTTDDIHRMNDAATFSLFGA